MTSEFAGSELEEAWRRFFEREEILGRLPRSLRRSLVARRHERDFLYRVSAHDIKSNEGASGPPTRLCTPFEVEVVEARSRLANQRENLGHLFVFVCGGRGTEGPFDTKQEAAAVQRRYPPGATCIIDLRIRPLRRPRG